jgi:hypothetical protein
MMNHMKKIIISIVLFVSVVALYAQSTITIYTPYGKSVQGIILSEFSPSEIAEINAYYTAQFPNATMIGSASSAYNCHSYAWNMLNGGPTYWINASVTGNNDNLSKYWTNDYYVQASSGTTAGMKVFYYNSDHSAVVSSVSGMYESKWGQAPLMRHAPNYGPYTNMSNRWYYYGRIYDTGSMIGSDVTYVGVSTSYTVPSIGISSSANPYYVWTVYDKRGNETTNVAQNPSENVTYITFPSKDLYSITCDVYTSIYQELHIARFYLEIVVDN